MVDDHQDIVDPPCHKIVMSSGSTNLANPLPMSMKKKSREIFATELWKQVMCPASLVNDLALRYVTMINKELKQLGSVQAQFLTLMSC